MADNTNQKNIFIANSIFPDASAVFSFQLQSLEEIKKDCYFVLDTNVLLAPYTIGKENLLEQCRKTYRTLADSKRLIIPGQVAREFAKLRQEKLAELFQQLSQKKQVALKSKGKYPLLSSLSDYQNITALEREIETKFIDYKNAIDKVLLHIQGWNWNDPVSTLYKQVFTEDMIIDLNLQEEEIKRDLHRRQEHTIPPGYKDAAKDDEGIGDLLIWYTILEIGNTYKKSVVFVSGDEKADWYKKSEGQPLYPRYELVDEFRRNSGGGSFHIIKFSRFLELFEASRDIIKDVINEENSYIAKPQQKMNTAQIQRIIDLDILLDTLMVQINEVETYFKDLGMINDPSPNIALVKLKRIESRLQKAKASLKNYIDDNDIEIIYFGIVQLLKVLSSTQDLINDKGPKGFYGSHQIREIIEITHYIKKSVYNYVQR